MDITDVIMDQHQEQRRMFALLDGLRGESPEILGAVWERLVAFLEVHAKGEELYFYPRLLEVGVGGGGQDSAAAETKDAVKDHNEIRDAIVKSRKQEVGSDGWWQAILEARTANGDHMAEEEREDLPDFRRHADLQTRHDIAVQFIAFEAQHPRGVPPENPDPATYVEKH